MSIIQVRVDETLKAEAERVFEHLGLDTPTAVRMFFKRVVLQNGMPFDLQLPATEEIKLPRAVQAKWDKLGARQIRKRRAAGHR